MAMWNNKGESFENLVYQYDDLIRSYRVLENTCEESFLKYVLLHEKNQLEYTEVANECKRLRSSLESAQKDISTLNSKIMTVRRMLDLERMRKKRIELSRNASAEKLEVIKHILLASYPDLPINVQKQLKNLEEIEANGKHNENYLSTIVESDCAISITNLSSTRSEDDLDESNTHSQLYRKHRPIDEEEPVAIKKRKSVILLGNGKENLSPIDFNKFNIRKHNFMSKNIIMPERCILCDKRIRFGQIAYKCSECNATSHAECRHKVPLPCVAMGTPTKKGTKGTISDLAPATCPRIPALIVHCINKIEQLGLSELGLYRVPGNEKDVRSLKEKFLKCKGVPSLEGIDIHTLCCCMKDFLRNLEDPLIPQDERKNFASAVADKNLEKLKTLVSSLPEANRHTLAYLILHLQRVAENVDCKMPLSNLATVFAPTIVGYSEVEPVDPFVEAQTAIMIMTELLEITSDFWNGLLTEKCLTECTVEEFCTPISKELKKPRKLLSAKNKRYFTSPMNRT